MTHTEKRLEEVLKIAVDRFLGWKLPADFSPDGGISFKSGVCETIGTHLFTAQQANEMLKYVLEEALASSIAEVINTEKISAEFESFDSFFAGLSMQDEKNAMKLYEKYIRSFFATSIAQALAEERERVREYLSHYKTKSDCCSQTVDDIYTNLSSLDINNNQ